MVTYEYTICSLYIGVLVYLTWIGYCGSSHTAYDYTVTRGDTNQYIVALSYGSTFISTAAIVGFGGVAAWIGNSMLWLAFLNIAVGIVFAFKVLAEPTNALRKRYSASTFAELMAAKYQSRAIRVAIACVIALFMPLYAAAVIIGGTEFIVAYYQTDYNTTLIVLGLFTALYVIIGGLRSVILTDAFQAIIMFIAILMLFFLVADNAGGINLALSKLDHIWLATVEPLRSISINELSVGSADYVYKTSLNMGYQGWNSFPVFLSEGWLFLVTTIILGVGIGALAQPQLIVRFMITNDENKLQRALPVGVAFIFVVVGLMYLIGTLTNIWYYEHNGGLNALQSVGSIDKIIPDFITRSMPRWYSFIFLFCLISAAMSTLSSQFHTMGTTIGNDILAIITNGRYGYGINDIRVVTIISVGITIAICLLINHNAAIIARSTAMFFALCASMFLPLYIGALFYKKASKEGAIASMIIGGVITLFWLLFVHVFEAKGLGVCKYLFGIDTLPFGKWVYLNSIVVALPTSAIGYTWISHRTWCEKVLKEAIAKHPVDMVYINTRYEFPLVGVEGRLYMDCSEQAIYLWSNGEYRSTDYYDRNRPCIY